MNRELLRLAVPNIIANLSIPLLGLVNVAVLAHLDSTTYLAAVSLTGVIFNFILWSFGFLRMSTTGITAQEFGAKNRSEISSALYRSFTISIFLGILIILLRNKLLSFGVFFLQPNSSILHIMEEYYNIRVFVIPASLLNFVIIGWLLGMQDSVAAMLMIVVENLVNVLLNLYFVVELGMKADGVALGALIAGWTALLFGISMLIIRHRKTIEKPVIKLIFIISKLKRVLTLNVNIFIRAFSLLMVFSWFTYASSKYGNDVLAINTLLMQFFMFFSFFIDGFAYAGESLSGKYLGAGKIKSLKITVKILFKWASVMAFVFSFIYLVAGNWIISLLTDNEILIEMAMNRKIWVVIIPIVSFAAFVWDGVFAGTTHAAAMRNVMLVSVVCVFFPLYFSLQNIFPETNLWIAFIAFFVARSLGMTIARPKFLRK